MIYLRFASIFLAILFIYYGIQCIFTKKMKLEFSRFGLSNQQRILTGILQLLGAIGLTLGISNLWIGAMASLGLGSLMMLGFIVRLKIKDNFIQAFPSFLLMVLNFILFASYLNLVNAFS